MRQSPKPLNSSRAEAASYAADMLASLRRLSEASGMTLLAHLVDLACAEAVRNAHAGDAAVGDAAETRGPERAPESQNN